MDVDSPALEDASRRRAAGLLSSRRRELRATQRRIENWPYRFEKHSGYTGRVELSSASLPEANHLRAQRRIGGYLFDRSRPSFRIVSLNQAGVRHNLRDGRGIVGSDGLACRHGLKKDDAKTFLETWEAEYIGVRVFRSKLFPADVAEECYTILQT